VHVSAILRALNVHTRTQAIVELARRGVDVDTLRVG
jgi:DNA-binding NarL/FixJ family response regulator